MPGGERGRQVVLSGWRLMKCWRDNLVASTAELIDSTRSLTGISLTFSEGSGPLNQGFLDDPARKSEDVAQMVEIEEEGDGARHLGGLPHVDGGHLGTVDARPLCQLVGAEPSSQPRLVEQAADRLRS
ncbi:MAG TPA: hypothetical protein VK428_04190 [Acidimicrobiales bacterium]|nr:hypothetical protein [Acidimicrobiales bacterium]